MGSALQEADGAVGPVDFGRSKYKNWLQFYKAFVVRGALRAYLRTLLRWSPLENAEPGYSVVIACNYNLREILHANLKLIAKQDHASMRALFIVFEVTEDEFPEDFRQRVLREHSSLPIQFVFYNRYQSRGLRAIDWPWTYAWMSWCKAIALCRTRFLILHDYDALPIRRDFFEDRFRRIAEGGKTYLGCSYYCYNGFVPADELATTWELVIDVGFVRERFAPVDAFNQVKRLGDRLLDFDTFLFMQKCAGKTEVIQAEVPQELVHLSQVISQHTQVLNGRQKSADNVLFVPYMLFVSGSPEPIEQMSETLKMSSWPNLVYFGKPIQTVALDWSHADWIGLHIRATEVALVGAVRPAAERYCTELLKYVERSRIKLPVRSAPPSDFARQERKLL